MWIKLEMTIIFGQVWNLFGINLQLGVKESERWWVDLERFRKMCVVCPIDQDWRHSWDMVEEVFAECIYHVYQTF